MSMYFLQIWLWLLLFFVLGSLLAVLIVHLLYRPVDEVREELDREFRDSTVEGVSR